MRHQHGKAAVVADKDLAYIIQYNIDHTPTNPQYTLYGTRTIRMPNARNFISTGQKTFLPGEKEKAVTGSQGMRPPSAETQTVIFLWEEVPLAPNSELNPWPQVYITSKACIKRVQWSAECTSRTACQPWQAWSSCHQCVALILFCWHTGIAEPGPSQVKVWVIWRFRALSWRASSPDMNNSQHVVGIIFMDTN